jgi:transcriptional regulator with XRE-family HTH domain
MNTIDKKLGEKVKFLRESNGLSQQDFAHKIGVSRPTVSQIESGDRKLNPDELLSIARLFNVSVDFLLNIEKGPQVVIEQKSEVKRHIQKTDIRISVPQKNLEKFKQVLLYILNKVGSKPNIGETVIYKLLYFMDFDYYERFEDQLIGATYIKNHFGPTPVEFKKIVEKMLDKEIIKVENKYFDYPQTKYLPLRPADTSIFNGMEMSVIDNVLNKLSDMNAAQISDYSHEDVPWMVTRDGKPIEYETVFYRTKPYSVRQYGEDIQKIRPSS